MYFYKIVSDSLPIPLTYQWPTEVTIGDIVILTIRNREILGVIIEPTEINEDFRIKPFTRLTGLNIGVGLVKFIKKL